MAALAGPRLVGAVELCGTAPTPPPQYDHVAWVFFENTDYGSIVGSGAAPFFNKGLGRACGLATNYYGITHPSLPNYIAATSGLSLDRMGPARENCNATPQCRLNARSIFQQATSWGAYAESIPKWCMRSFHGRYAASHNPAVFYRQLEDCPERAVGLKELKAALVDDQLPQFFTVTPNMCNGMHDCSVSTGDRWLRRLMRLFADSAAYQRGRMAIFVTFDESDGGNNHIATYVVSPSVIPGTKAGARFDHYSLLRTTEEMLGIGEYLGLAAKARSMRRAFNL
jgi:phosphatidylinositol-3-phosphatase